MSATPFAASWLIESEQRSPRVVLDANPTHWNRAERGPRVERAIFRNDVTPDEALRLCCTTDGEVDIVTEVSSADAQMVLDSAHADLVVCDANRVLVGILNRAADSPLAELDVRRALNHAVNRQRIVDEGLAGYASVISALTPPWSSGYPDGAQPYAHDPAAAKQLWSASTWPARRPIVLAAGSPFAGVAQLVAGDLRSALGVKVDVVIVEDDAMPAGARALVEKKLDLPWDILIFGWFDLSSEAPPAAVHREFFGTDGAFRAGPPDQGFDALYDEMKVQLDGEALVEVAERIDAYCHDNALALFLCAPQALYAVNKHVTFGPYKTTFEIAEVTVDEQHWSRNGSSSTHGDPSVPGAADGSATKKKAKPGFSGAAGNAC